MNRKLLKAILLISLFLKSIDSQACPGNQVQDPPGSPCACSNTINTDCGTTKKSFNNIQCGCECNNKGDVGPTCTGVLFFDEASCECKCQNKENATCKSPLIFLESPDCRCGCPSPAPACTCVGATIDENTCVCKTPVNKCKNVVWNCVTGKFDYPPKEDIGHSWDCKEWDEDKCKWKAPVDCPANQHYIPVYDDATTKVCGCAKLVDDCTRYQLNPNYDSTDNGSQKYICQGCAFPKQYMPNSKKCVTCECFTIKTLDPNCQYKETGYITFSGVTTQKPSDASLVITPSPLSNDIVSKKLDRIFIHEEHTAGPNAYFIRNLSSVPGKRLRWRWNSDPKFFLSHYEKQPGSDVIHDQLIWQIETDPAANSIDTYRAKILSKDKAFALAHDLTIGPSASIAADRFEFEMKPVC